MLLIDYSLLVCIFAQSIRDPRHVIITMSWEFYIKREKKRGEKGSNTLSAYMHIYVCVCVSVCVYVYMCVCDYSHCKRSFTYLIN